MSILITGSAGFIGYHLCRKLLSENYEVFGLDNINNYYDVNLKNERIKDLKSYSKTNNFRFHFIKGDLTNNNDLERVFHNAQESNSNNCSSNITIVINLAAQAGVRFSIENPNAYVQSNLVGFCNLIEKCKENKVKHFIYASSSSVYGGNKKLPFEETDSVDHPISLYAATKKSNELIAHTYSHLFKLPTTGLRFFTVYGPWGRPDMALFKFTDSIIKNEPIRVFNYGKMTRDFTYIKDVIDSISVLINKSPIEEKYNSKISYNPSNSWAPYRVFNIGNSNPICLNDYIKAIEKNLNKKAEIILEGMQPGDVESTFASTDLLEEWINFKPKTSINDGIKKFVDWYLSYYKRS